MSSDDEYKPTQQSPMKGPLATYGSLSVIKQEPFILLSRQQSDELEADLNGCRGQSPKLPDIELREARQGPCRTKIQQYATDC